LLNVLIQLIDFIFKRHFFKIINLLIKLKIQIIYIKKVIYQYS